MSDSLAERYIAQFAKQGTPFVGRDLCERMLRDVELSGKLQGVTKALEELIHYLTPDGRAKAQAMLSEMRNVTSSVLEKKP